MNKQSRLAIFGSSHSAYKDADGEPWPLWLARDNPHIQVDNYSMGGHSAIYNDFILRNCIINNSYDAIIVEVPSLVRWYIPLMNKVAYSSEHTDYVLGNSKVTEVTENYRNINSEDILNQKKLLPANPGQSVMGFGNQFYASIAIHSIESIYKLIHKNIFWFFWPPGSPEIAEWLPDNRYNNIGHKLSPFDFFMEKYQDDFFKVMTRYYDNNDTHFSSMGSKIMYNDYIKTSQIGSWLKEK